jgi:alanyl-tRNA synthetase
LIARERGLSLDEQGFHAAMEEQKQRSKADAASEKGDWNILIEDLSEFVGYDTLETESRILKYREVSDKNGKLYQLVLDKTPFYGESGGQIGDQGYLRNGSEDVFIYDTQKENDLIVHYTKKLPAKVESTFRASVDGTRRAAIKNNHSATHLMHAALREVLGDHVQQKGSLVSEEVLRFDFSHFQKVTDEELLRIEQIVNERIRQNIVLNEKRNVPIDEARAMGAMALFGEKYGDFVRVITFDPTYSVELCGGTHVPATGVIGTFKIVSESAVAAGVRRIEAYTGAKAFGYIQEHERLLSQVKDLLKGPKDLEKAIQSLLDEQKKLTKEIEGLHAKQAGQVKTTLIGQINEQNGISVLIEEVKLPNADALKKLSFELKNEVKQLFAVLAADIAGKPQIAVVIDEELVKAKGLNAGSIIRDLAKHIKGGGGGQPFFATAGGKDVNGLSAVVAEAKNLAESL